MSALTPIQNPRRELYFVAAAATTAVAATVGAFVCQTPTAKYTCALAAIASLGLAISRCKQVKETADAIATVAQSVVILAQAASFILSILTPKTEEKKK